MGAADNSSKPVSRVAAALWVFASLMIGVAAVAQEESGAGQSEERETRKVSGINAKTFEKFAEAQELMEAGDYAGTKRVLDELKAKEKRTGAESIQLWSFYGVMYFSQEKYRESITAFESMLAEPELGERQRTETLYTIAQLRFTIEDWQGAINIMSDWIKVVENPPPEPFILLASAHYQLEQYAKMVEPVKRAMKISEERGKPAKEQWWLLLRVAYYELNNLPEVTRILEILVANWPKKDYWIMLAGMYGELNKEAQQLAAMEAAYDQNLLDKSGELVTLAQLLMQGEAAYKAAKVMQTGFDGGLIEPTVANYRLLSQAWQVAAEFDKAIQPLKKASEISQDGELDLRLANSYLNLGRYEECANAVRDGLKRGGLDRPAAASELLGMCLFELDQFDQAISAFRRAAEDKDIQKRARNWIKYIETEQARLNQLNESIRQAKSALQASES